MLRLTVCAALIIADNAGVEKQPVASQEQLQPIPEIVHPDQNEKVKEAFSKAINVSQLETLKFNQPLYEPGNPIDWRLWTAIYVNNEPLAQDMVKTYSDQMLHAYEMLNVVGISCQCEEGCDPCFESVLGLSIIRKMNNVTNTLLGNKYTNVNIQSHKYHNTWTILETPLVTSIKTQNENALRSLLRHPHIDVSLKIVQTTYKLTDVALYSEISKNTAIDEAKQQFPEMIPIIQEEMCNFIARAHKDEEKKRQQFIEYIPNEKACDYIQNNIAYDADKKGKSNDDKDKLKTAAKSTKTSSKLTIIFGIIAMALGAVVLCYFFLKPLLMKKRDNQEKDEIIV